MGGTLDGYAASSFEIRSSNASATDAVGRRACPSGSVTGLHRVRRNDLGWLSFDPRSNNLC